MAGWFAGRLAPAPVSQSCAPLMAGAPDSGHGRNDMVSNPVPDFGFSGFQSTSNDVHIDYECLSHLKWASLRPPHKKLTLYIILLDYLKDSAP